MRSPPSRRRVISAVEPAAMWLLWVAVFVAGVASAEEQVFFAFDDVNLGWQHNLRLTLQAPRKHPANPVLRCGPEGSADFGHAILYGTVLHDGTKFRMWYLGMIQRELASGQAPGWWRPMCYAESTDGVQWTKPELGLVDVHGNKRNNVCLVEAEVPSMALVNDFLSVLYEPNDPDPQQRYKVAYIAHMPKGDIRGGMSGVGIPEGRVGAFITATSADGLRWRVVGDRPANAGGERFEVSGLYRFGDFYYASGQLASPWSWLNDGREVGRMMMTYRSPDFLHWSRAKALSMVLLEQQTEPQPPYGELLQGFGKQMHMGVGVWNRGNVMVGLHGIWQGQPRNLPKGSKSHEGLKIDLGLAISNDGVKFREPIPNFTFLKHGEPNEWDSIALLQGHAFVNIGDETYIWYSHWDCESAFRSQEIGLATMVRDRFGYLSRHDAGDPGHCVSSVLPVTEAGHEVSVNVSGVSERDPIRVELLDSRDQAVPGYSGADAGVVASDGVRQSVVWPSTRERRTPAGKGVTLRVTLPDNDTARLYAIYVN